MGTLIVLVILLVIVTLVIRRMIRDKKSGKTCSCGHCSNSCRQIRDPDERKSGKDGK